MIDKLINIYDEVTKSSRLEALAQLGREYKFDFQKHVSFGKQRTDLNIFKAFSKKGAKRMLGVLSQESQVVKGTVRFYDYAWTRDLETKRHSIIEISTDDILTDYTVIEPKNTFDRMKGFFVSEEKQFPDLEEFYQKFHISTKEENAAYWLNPKALFAMIDYPKITMEAEGNNFLFYIWKKEMKIKDIISTIDFAEEFVRLTCYDHSGDFV